MARYTGSKHKLARREGVNIIDKSSASLQRRLNIPPGIHGKRRKRRLSEYGLQLREKQKLKAAYGIMEKQLKKIVEYVEKKKGDTGELLIAYLETRLDNVVYRLGFARSRYQARQLVTHRHILINDKKVNIPSYRVKPDNIVSLSPKIQKNTAHLKTLDEKKEVLPFLEREGLSGKLARVPKLEDLIVPFNTQMIVEYYSR